MRKNLVLVLLIIIITSCGQSKKYKYIEIEQKESLFGTTDLNKKNVVIIRVKNDSIAYLAAYQKFCISEKVSQNMKEAFGVASAIPIDFKLIDEQGNDVALLINFDKIDSLKNSVRNKIFKMKNSLKETIDNSKKKKIKDFKKSFKIDSAKVSYW